MTALSSFTYSCAICEEPSQRICYYCTKDTCANHLCLKCNRCSDCCLCEVPLEQSHPAAAAPVESSAGEIMPVSEPESAAPEPSDPLPQEMSSRD